MNHSRLAGIDLGIATTHTVRVRGGEGRIVAKRKAWPTAESLTTGETAALAGCPQGTGLEVVIEPAGPAWLPIAVFFGACGQLLPASPLTGGLGAAGLAVPDATQTPMP